MAQTTSRYWTRMAEAVFATVTLATAPAAAKAHHHVKTNRMLCERMLANGKTTDLFLRQGSESGLFLYVASANGTLSIYDVSNSSEPRELNTLALSGDKPAFQIRQVNDDVVVSSGAPDSSKSLTVLNLANAPSAEIAKTLKDIDAYAIDRETNTLYVAQREKLSVMQFDHPITREAEIWEQSYEAR